MTERDMQEQLERAYDVTLVALGDAMDLKYSGLEAHSRRVAAFAIAIARQMRIPKHQVNIIARGAFLHDIGKIAIPDDILRKPAKLTADEMRIMQEHCYRGYQMISRIPFLEEAAQIVYSHHERADGTGYPRKLKGEQIPLGARIVSVAGALDVITSDVGYRRARYIQDAREEIERCSGSQFDSDVVKAFLSMDDKVWEDLRNEIRRRRES
jgi:putative nucleotidyltransferase with HDIG domain